MHEDPIDFFVELERQVWDALMRGDASADRELLGSDFVGVYPSGFADRSDHAGELVDGPTVAAYVMADERLIRLTESAVLLCYRAEYRPVQDEVAGDEETMYVSSLWVERDGRWWNTFSQDTPEQSPTAAPDA
jgi:hypothetical protein